MRPFNCLVYFCLSLLLSGCQMYRTDFDCPPGVGVPCTPVTDIEKMIVETPKGGPDIFLGYLPSESILSDSCRNKCCDRPQRRVWIESKTLPCGTYIEGHYIYINTPGKP
ncbi:MAG: hypothetical protein ACHQUC_02870 [Chlamydiales bacterium]